MNINLLTEMCMFCNNWFNRYNEPRDFHTEHEPFKGVSPSFLALHERIQAFLDNEDITKDNTTSERVGEHSETLDLNFSAWQIAFRNELALYKRARFL